MVQLERPTRQTHVLFLSECTVKWGNQSTHQTESCRRIGRAGAALWRGEGCGWTRLRGRCRAPTRTRAPPRLRRPQPAAMHRVQRGEDAGEFVSASDHERARRASSCVSDRTIDLHVDTAFGIPCLCMCGKVCMGEEAVGLRGRAAGRSGAGLARNEKDEHDLIAHIRSPAHRVPLRPDADPHVAHRRERLRPSQKHRGGHEPPRAPQRLHVLLPHHPVHGPGLALLFVHPPSAPAAPHLQSDAARAACAACAGG